MATASALRFQTLREEVGLTQAQFAKIVGVSQIATISRWENGRAKPQKRQLQSIAAATGASVEQVRSWMATGKPELHLLAVHGGRGQAGTLARGAAADAGSEELERSLAYWHWRTQLTPEDRKRARTVYIRVVDRGELPPPPRVWEPGSAGQRKG